VRTGGAPFKSSITLTLDAPSLITPAFAWPPGGRLSSFLGSGVGTMSKPLTASATSQTGAPKGPSPAVMSTYARQDIVFARGDGAWLETETGERYLDFGSGVAVNALGHAHPHLVSALKDQAEKLWHTSNLYRVAGQEKLAGRLVEEEIDGYIELELFEAARDEGIVRQRLALSSVERPMEVGPGTESVTSLPPPAGNPCGARGPCSPRVERHTGGAGCERTGEGVCRTSPMRTC